MLENDGSLVLCWTLFWWVTFTAAVVVVTTTESDMWLFSLFFDDFFNSELLSSTITKESILLLLDSCRSRLDLELESSSSSSSSSCWPQTPIKTKKNVFCYQNCSDLLWEKMLRSLEQFFLKVGQNNYGNKIHLFLFL